MPSKVEVPLPSSSRMQREWGVAEVNNERVSSNSIKKVDLPSINTSLAPSLVNILSTGVLLNTVAGT